jgi:hypothetical protein
MSRDYVGVDCGVAPPTYSKHAPGAALHRCVGRDGCVALWPDACPSAETYPGAVRPVSRTRKFRTELRVGERTTVLAAE